MVIAGVIVFWFGVTGLLMAPVMRHLNRVGLTAHTRLLRRGETSQTLQQRMMAADARALRRFARLRPLFLTVLVLAVAMVIVGALIGA